MSGIVRLRCFVLRCVLCRSLPLLLAASSSSADPEDAGGLWVLGLGQGDLGRLHPRLEKARWWLDVQGRWREENSSLGQVLVRPGVGWAVTERVSIIAGYAWINTDPPGRGSFDEHRAWQHLVWKLPVAGFGLQSRTRLEQRVVDRELGWRAREFLKGTLPLTGDRRLFLSVYDELFVELDDTDWGQRVGIRQNRAFAGVGWRLNEKRGVTLEGGYLNQWISRRGRDRVNHILSLNLFLDF